MPPPSVLTFAVVIDGRILFVEELGRSALSLASGADNFDARGSDASSANIESASSSQIDNRHLHEFVLHASLDAIATLTWTKSAFALGVVDSFNDLVVSAYKRQGVPYSCFYTHLRSRRVRMKW